MHAGRGGENFLDRWLLSDEEKKENGTTECSYWGWYGAQRNFYEGDLVFSFVRISKSSNEWLFVSAAEIVDVPPASRANYIVLEKYKSLFGRLIIRHEKGNALGRYVFKLSSRLDDCVVKEILPCQYSGEQFEGYDRVHLDFNKLDDVFAGKIMPTYYDALKKITGVYCLTDIKTGKLYIGAAYGEGGVAQRWGNYLNSKHGGNKKLIDLYNDKGAEYFKENFTFTLLEYFGLSYDPNKIIAREEYWKECFSTIKNGYNGN
jgi:hypothetical protein